MHICTPNTWFLQLFYLQILDVLDDPGNCRRTVLKSELCRRRLETVVFSGPTEV